MNGAAVLYLTGVGVEFPAVKDISFCAREVRSAYLNAEIKQHFKCQYTNLYVADVVGYFL